MKPNPQAPGRRSAPGGLSRRGFLKAAGFGLAGTVISGCSRSPVEKAIPFLNPPETIVPGKAVFYATTCGGCAAGCGALAKVRDGRPIKLEGNPDHPVSRGGLCAVGQASLLGLYDNQRLRSPLRDGRDADWTEVDPEIRRRLDRIRRERGRVRFLTETITSPTLARMIRRFLEGFADARHVMYDPLSAASILDAHLATHGARLLPRYLLDKAEVIVGCDADFLGTWISPVEYTRGYRLGRDLEHEPPRFSYHVQFETRLSLTGSKADRRHAVSPEATAVAIHHLLRRVANKAGIPLRDEDPGHLPVPAQDLDRLAERLWRARGRSLVLCGLQDTAAQILTNCLNELLENYGRTLDLERPSLQRRGDDRALADLLREIDSGSVQALFIHGVDPAADLPGGESLLSSLAKVRLVVSFAQRRDETAPAAHFICPDHHALESWGDSEPVSGVVGVQQPAIRPLWNTRSPAESLAAWMGEPADAYLLLRRSWSANIHPRAIGSESFETFWQRAVHDGFVEVRPQSQPARFVGLASLDLQAPRPATAAPGFTLVAYPKVGMLDGRHSYNPWLQELPDPITKVVWDNYACLAPEDARSLGVGDGDVVRLEVSRSGRGLELPVCVQPGQAPGCVAVALGYGRELTRRFASIGPRWIEGRPSTGEDGLVGKNVNRLFDPTAGARMDRLDGVTVRPLGRRAHLACAQDRETLLAPEGLALPGTERRPVIRETTLADHLERRHGVSPRGHGSEEAAHRHEDDLWPDDHPYKGHHWGMAIDLSACTGCSACVIACQAENNIPVVGKDEVGRKRAMHWMRIDRYYSGDESAVEVVHQPMFCQQCDHAPCETVCPVLATVHNSEGLNVQVYNRCVGTRYCSNNCPYKVRRFNWFNPPPRPPVEDLVLNPDVTVRMRGIMEKCTFCVQRIEAARIEARVSGRPLSGGDVRPACQESCPAGAIVFGDLNDPESRLSRLVNDPRAYRVLEELNVRPSVTYLSAVRNREEGGKRRV